MGAKGCEVAGHASHTQTLWQCVLLRWSLSPTWRVPPETNMYTKRRSLKISGYCHWCDDLELCSRSRRGSWTQSNTSAIPRACGLVNCLLTVILYNYSPSRQNSRQTWVNSFAETFRIQLQGRQMKMLWRNECFHYKQLASQISPVNVTLSVLKESEKVTTPWHWLE